MQDPASEVLRIPLLGTGVKIDLVLPHFHPPVVARGAMGNWCENSLGGGSIFMASGWPAKGHGSLG